MANLKLAEEIRKAIQAASGQITFSELESERFIYDQGKRVPKGTSIIFQVKFRTKNHAERFMDSVAPILPNDPEFSVANEDEGIVQVSFDPP